MTEAEAHATQKTAQTKTAQTKTAQTKTAQTPPEADVPPAHTPPEPPPPGPPWDAPLTEARLVFLDLEMTGLDAESDRVCEVAAIAYRGAREVDRLASLVNPGVPVGASEKIHRISDEALAEAPTLTELREPLAAILHGAVLVGHAIHFDQAFLSAASMRGEIAAPPALALDTRRLARRAWHLGGYGLAALCEGRGLTRPSHRAEADALACAALLFELARELRAKTPRQLFQAQPEPGVRSFREDVGEVLDAASARGTAVRLAYRVPGRDAFVDEAELLELDATHVLVNLRGRGLRKQLRGDRVLWAEHAD